MPAHPKPKAWRSKKYLDFIKKQQSLLLGHGDIISHHVRIDNNAGVGMKPSDFYCVPLFVSTHNAFHQGIESDREFWIMNGIDIYRTLFELYTKFNRG